MDIFTNKAHDELRLRVREFAEKEVRPKSRELDEKEQFSPELSLRMGELGLFGIAIPKEYGGQGLDYMSFIIAIEELARVDSSQAAILASHNSLGIGPLYRYGTEEQRRKFVPQLCTGKALWAFGLTEENAGSDSRGTESRAVLEGDEWVINGSKLFISNASTTISAGVTIQVITGEKDGKKELSTILVETGTPGYRAEKIRGKMMWRAIDTARLYFNHVRVPKANLLGNLGDGSKIMLETLDSGRLTLAAMGLGLARGAFEMAMNYAQKRQQFGKPISKFQVNAFKLADMATKIELARNLLYHATWLKDNGQQYAKEAAMAKLYCSEIAREIADESLQIHGAYGLMREYDIERFYRDQRLLQIGEGTSEILRLVISRHLGL
ncbi:MAG TPA: acyl-CoA dehydrogenase family protein [Bacteroidales bacterium]|nr:acyl-CoA dehydrogenase family protein [Bacteroidales bacterium]